jgi:hypothetical protein
MFLDLFQDISIDGKMFDSEMRQGELQNESLTHKQKVAYYRHMYTLYQGIPVLCNQSWQDV